jgi:hypothetical protein
MLFNCDCTYISASGMNLLAPMASTTRAWVPCSPHAQLEATRCKVFVHMQLPFPCCHLTGHRSQLLLAIKALSVDCNTSVGAPDPWV